MTPSRVSPSQSLLPKSPWAPVFPRLMTLVESSPPVALHGAVPEPALEPESVGASRSEIDRRKLPRRGRVHGRPSRLANTLWQFIGRDGHRHAATGPFFGSDGHRHAAPVATVRYRAKTPLHLREYLDLILGKISYSLRACPCTSSSAVERSAYTGLVGGSIPSSCTNFPESLGVFTQEHPGQTSGISLRMSEGNGNRPPV